MKRKFYFVLGLILILTIALTGCFGETNNDSSMKSNFKVTGKIKGLKKGKVKVGNQSGKINSKGVYAVKNITSGKHKILVYSAGQKVYEEQIQLTDNLVKNIEEKEVYNCLIKNSDLKLTDKKVPLNKSYNLQKFVTEFSEFNNSKTKFEYDVSFNSGNISVQGFDNRYHDEREKQIEIFEGDVTVELSADIYLKKTVETDEIIIKQIEQRIDEKGDEGAWNDSNNVNLIDESSHHVISDDKKEAIIKGDGTAEKYWPTPFGRKVVDTTNFEIEINYNVR